MCGILSLYAAIIQTDAIPNSYGMENGWKWMARLLNMKPRKITPLLIHTFLVVAGSGLMKKYGTQARKLIHVIVEGIIPIIPTAAIASTTKLKLFLEETVLLSNTFDVHPSSILEP